MAHKKLKDRSIHLENDEELDWFRETHATLIDDNVRLESENQDLRAENKKILDELTRLRQKIESSISPTRDSKDVGRQTKAQRSEHATINGQNQSPSTALLPAHTASYDRIAIFKSLFRGRTDVYAKRWESQKGTSGYSPACSMEWKRPHCTKPQIKCTKCIYSQLSEQVISSHLAGHLTVGVYPLLTDDSSLFLAADFDGDDWQQDALSYLKTCRALEIPAYLERSRSGNGGHVWIFFDTQIPAQSARRLGSLILTKTMEDRHEIKFKAYDRFFPNQDFLPRGGFGNLIALPLNGQAAKAGNSVFIDDQFQAIPDQWLYLKNIQRLSLRQMEDLVSTSEREGNIVGVRLSVADGEQDDPWTLPPSKKKKEKPISVPLPSSIEVIQSNMLFIESSGLPSPFLNRLKRLAAFQNPEFYKMQTMRMPTYKTPRIIGCADDMGRHIALPRGLEDEVGHFLSENNVVMKVIDKRFRGPTIDLQFHGQLKPEQERAVSELLAHETGTLAATTAFGKTVIGAHMIAARNTNTLILVHRQELLEQWRERLSHFLNIAPRRIGQIGGGKLKPNGFLDIAMIQSLVRDGVVKDLVAEYGHVIVDECHHVAAFSFESVMKQVRAKYVLGLTATPKRKDGHHPIIVMQCGPIRYRVSSKEQSAFRPFQHLIFQKTTPVQPDLGSNLNYQELCSYLMNSVARNDLIISDVRAALNEGRCPLVLTERKEHVEMLAKGLLGHCDHVITLYGGRSKREREAELQRVREVSSNEKRVIVATGKYIGEGFDDPRLDTLFLALPFSWTGTLQQYAGRLHRLYEGKEEVRVYDYVDASIPMASSMFDKRRKGYKVMGYHFVDDRRRLL